MSAILLLMFVLFAFALPGTQSWSFPPDAPLFGIFGIDQSFHEHDRIVGPIRGVLARVGDAGAVGLHAGRHLFQVTATWGVLRVDTQDVLGAS